MKSIAPITLFCFPHAGASAHVYAQWQRLLPQWMTVRPIELPGRGERSRESLIEDFSVLIRKLTDELFEAACATRRYALFGHSLGGLIAFELAYALTERGAPAPAALFVSGVSGPIEKDQREAKEFPEPPTDAQLMERLRRLNGMPTALLENAELMEMVLPVLSADYHLYASYRRPQRAPLNCPIYAFGGTHDPIVSSAALQTWECETTAQFSTEMFDGDHFFIRDHETVLLQRLESFSALCAMEAA